MFYIDIETGVIGESKNLVLVENVPEYLFDASDSEITEYALIERMTQDGYWD